MPKNRKRANRKGAKSISIRTKHKIGGRKAGIGASTLTENELAKRLRTCRKRDKNKLRRAWIEMEKRQGVTTENLEQFLEISTP